MSTSLHSPTYRNWKRNHQEYQELCYSVLRDATGFYLSKHLERSSGEAYCELCRLARWLNFGFQTHFTALDDPDAVQKAKSSTLEMVAHYAWILDGENGFDHDLAMRTVEEYLETKQAERESVMRSHSLFVNDWNKTQ